MQLTYFDYYSRILLSLKIWTDYVYESLSCRGKNFHLVLILQLWRHLGLVSIQKVSIHGLFCVEKFGILKLNISWTKRGIYKRSAVPVSFSLTLHLRSAWFWGKLSLYQPWIPLPIATTDNWEISWLTNQKHLWNLSPEVVDGCHYVIKTQRNLWDVFVRNKSKQEMLKATGQPQS